MRRSTVINLLNPKTPPTFTFGQNEPDDDLALVCQRCGAPVEQYDPTGGAWCDQPPCASRAALLWQGYHRDYPKLTSAGVGINAGSEGWIAFARYAPDQRVQAVRETIHRREGRAA